MGDTILINIFKDIWTEVVASGSGFVTNESDNIILYIESDTQPSSNITKAHTLQRRDYVRYELTDSNKVWARSVFDQSNINTDAFIIVTPD